MCSNSIPSVSSEYQRYYNPTKGLCSKLPDEAEGLSARNVEVLLRYFSVSWLTPLQFSVVSVITYSTYAGTEHLRISVSQSSSLPVETGIRNISFCNKNTVIKMKSEMSNIIL